MLPNIRHERLAQGRKGLSLKRVAAHQSLKPSAQGGLTTTIREPRNSTLPPVRALLRGCINKVLPLPSKSQGPIVTTLPVVLMDSCQQSHIYR